MYNEVAYLIRKTDTGEVDEYGDKIFAEERSTIYVKIKSVGMSEFYTSRTAGYDPTIIFVIADYYDYSEQPFVEYLGEMYKIIRTYRKGVSLEIVCQHNE